MVKGRQRNFFFFLNSWFKHPITTRHGPGPALSQLDQLLPIGSRASVIPCWSYQFLAVLVHTTTHWRFYREQHRITHLSLSFRL